MTNQPEKPRTPNLSDWTTRGRIGDSIRRASSDRTSPLRGPVHRLLHSHHEPFSDSSMISITPRKPCLMIVNSFITQNAGTATLAAIGLSLMTVHAGKFSRFIANRVSKRRTGPFVKGPGV